MEDRTRDLFLAFGGGLLVAVAAPVVAPIVDEAFRPLAKAILRQGMLGLERFHTSSARISEALDDLVAEVRAEVETELATEAQGAEATPEGAEGAAGARSSRKSGPVPRAS